jgi:hypothetical protein
MSTMSQSFQTVEDIVPLVGPRRTVGSKVAADFSRLKTPARLLAGLFLAPLLLVLALLGFLVVLADFAWFRLRDVRDGHPQPKGLWEF